MPKISSLTEEQLDAAEIHLQTLFLAILDNRESLSKRISNLKSPYYLNKISLLGEPDRQDFNLREIERLLGVPYELPYDLRSEARGYDEPKPIIERACRLSVNFIINLMTNPKLDQRLVSAVFADLNLLGYMFDRTPENYIRCKNELMRLIVSLDVFKQKLTTENLAEWNRSTFSGRSDGQCLRFMSFIWQATQEPLPIPLEI